MKKKKSRLELYSSGYITCKKFDKVLSEHARKGDWVQLRGGFECEGLTSEWIYPIEEIVRKEKQPTRYARLTDNSGETIEVSLEILKYITYQQRESIARVRGLNSANNH